MLIYLVILLIIIPIIFLFSSPKLSPIPYFPSQPVDMPLIVKALNLRNKQTVIDLGAGDGIVIFKAAQQAYKRKLNTQFVAVEINPVLILVLHLRRLFHSNKKNIFIFYGDIFTIDFDNFTNFMNFKNFITVYLYISPWYLEKTISNIKYQISKFSVVSYMYPLNEKTTFAKASVVKGKNKIFIYS